MAGATASVYIVLINWRHSQQLGQVPGWASSTLTLRCRAYHLPASLRKPFLWSALSLIRAECLSCERGLIQEAVGRSHVRHGYVNIFATKICVIDYEKEETVLADLHVYPAPSTDQGRWVFPSRRSASQILRAIEQPVLITEAVFLVGMMLFCINFQGVSVPLVQKHLFFCSMSCACDAALLMRDQTSTLQIFYGSLWMHVILFAEAFEISLSWNLTAFVEIDVLLGLTDVWASLCTKHWGGDTGQQL